MSHTIRIHAHKDQEREYWRAGPDVALRNIGEVLDRPWSEQERWLALDAIAHGKLVEFRVPTAAHYHIIRCYLESAGFIVNEPRPEVYDLR